MNEKNYKKLKKTTNNKNNGFAQTNVGIAKAQKQTKQSKRKQKLQKKKEMKKKCIKQKRIYNFN